MEKVVIDVKSGKVETKKLTKKELKEREELEKENQALHLQMSKENMERRQRALLAETDWTQVLDAQDILTKKCIDEFKKYREKLREINNKFPSGLDEDGKPVEFPKKPKVVKKGKTKKKAKK